MNMESNCELFSIFPTPVVKFKVPEDIMGCAYTLKDRTNQRSVPSSHTISADNYILNHAEYDVLKKWIIGRTTEFMRLVLCIDSDALITQSWVNKNSPGQYTHTHPHQNSFVSGVLYLYVPDGNALIVFHKRPAGSDGHFILEPKWYPNDGGRDFTYADKEYKMPVSAGELVLFPSWLLHSVPTNKTTFDRWSLAFNAVTQIGIGEGRELTEFIYPRS